MYNFRINFKNISKFRVFKDTVKALDTENQSQLFEKHVAKCSNCFLFKTYFQNRTLFLVNLVEVWQRNLGKTSKDV